MSSMHIVSSQPPEGMMQGPPFLEPLIPPTPPKPPSKETLDQQCLSKCREFGRLYNTTYDGSCVAPVKCTPAEAGEVPDKMSPPNHICERYETETLICCCTRIGGPPEAVARTQPDRFSTTTQKTITPSPTKSSLRIGLFVLWLITVACVVGKIISSRK